MSEPTSQSNAKTSYETTIKMLLHTERGAYGDVNYLPAFRASAIFYAVVDQDRTTHVSFLNYWREKNDNASVGALLSLRDSDGTLRARSFFPVDQMAYQIDVRDLMANAEDVTVPFTGTIEVELHSSEDLKFAFPALLVFYETPRGISYVHTNQRIYNDLQDRRRGDPFNPDQTGFDVSCKDGASPFVFVANGSEPVSDAVAKLNIYDSDGREMESEITLGDLPAFAARRLEIAEIDGVRQFLGDGVGFLKLDLPLGNIYNRFGCGVESAAGDWIGITHSYFDCLRHNDYYATNAFPPDVHHCFVPVNLVEGLDTEVVFYPIMAPASLSFRLVCFDAKGGERATIDLPGSFKASGSEQIRINLRQILSDREISADEGLYAILVEAEDGKLPTRVSFGLNYRSNGLPGCNISSSTLLASSHGVRSRAWLWGALPCRSGARNIIMVSHMPKEKAATDVATFSVSIYNGNAEICSRNFESLPRTGENIVAEEMLADANYIPGERDILWYVVRSESSSLISNQIHISADGYIGGDHSF